MIWSLFQMTARLNQSSLSGVAGSLFYWLKTGKIWVILTGDDHQSKHPPSPDPVSDFLFNDISGEDLCLTLIDPAAAPHTSRTLPRAN